MSTRRLMLLLGLLALFVVAWAVARFGLNRGGGPAESESGFDLAANAELAVDSLIVASPEDTIRVLGGDPWTVNGHEALRTAGEAVKRALEEARVGDLVSRNPENHRRLGVAEGEGRRLTLYAGGAEALALIVGERVQAFDEAYARRADDDRVYTLKGNLVNLANRDVDGWRNKAILSAERSAIQRIEFTYPDESFALARDTIGWRVEPSGATASPSELSRLLGALSELNALGFAADSVTDTLTWEPPTARVRVRGPDDAELGELTFLRREENVGYYVRRRGAPTVYTLSAFNGDQVLKREPDLTASEQSG